MDCLGLYICNREVETLDTSKACLYITYYKHRSVLMVWFHGGLIAELRETRSVYYKRFSDQCSFKELQHKLGIFYYDYVKAVEELRSLGKFIF